MSGNASPSMRPFFIIWTGQAFSLFGSQVIQFALIWWLTIETGSAVVLAGAAIMAFLPQVLLTPFAGALVDRWNRRVTMIAADTSIALVTVVLILLFALGWIEFWHIYIAMFLRSTGAAFHFPAFLASTSLMVPKEHLTRIGGLNQALQGAMNIVAPPVAAVLIAVIPMHGILVVDVVTAMVAVGALLAVVIPQPPPSPTRESVISDMREGFRFLRGWRAALLMIGIAMGINFVLAPAVSLIPIFVVNHFHGGAGEFAALESLLGVGMIVGGVVLGVWGGFKKKVRTVVMGLSLMGVGSLGLAAVPADMFVAALVAIFLLAFMMAMVNGTLLAVLQATIPPGIQGRVFALLNSGSMAMMPIGLAVAGPIAELFSVQFWFLVSGIVLLFAGLGVQISPSLATIENGPPRSLLQESDLDSGTVS